MHHLMAGYASVGHIYGDPGLGELLVESDVYIVGSIQHNLSVKKSLTKFYENFNLWNVSHIVQKVEQREQNFLR